MHFKKKGFTLIELLVVMIIVGILASAAIPMMRGNVIKARKSEAVAALGTIRTAERAYFAENGSYRAVSGQSAALRIADLNALNIGPTDLDGRYFSTECYTVNSYGGGPYAYFVAFANPNTSTAPAAAQVRGTGTLSLDSNGNITGY